MEQMEFNLLDEPWIRVMTEDCTVVERSLMQVLLNSHQYQRLAGELPTQDVALLRLLLAILQTVFYRVDPEGEDDPIEDRAAAIRRWQALWNAGRFPVQPIRTYLETWKDHFWLFHPEHPFYQVPAAAVGTKFKASKLNGELSESAHKMRLFPLRDGEEKETLSYAEAARWLVTLIGFDDSASTKKETGTGTGWLGDRVNVYAIGENLFETLILNLVFLKDGKYVWAENIPAWEQPTMTTAKKREIPLPDNQAELLTLQSRRLILSREENRVTGFSSTGGDFFGKEGRINAFSEQMTLWRAGKTPKNAVPQFVPASVDPWRQMWRDFEVILGRREDTHIPGGVAWLTELRRKNVIQKTPEAVRAFVDAFIRSMPTGKQNTFANWTRPDAVYVTVRKDQPINLAGAFEKPVRAGNSGYVDGSIRALVTYAQETYADFASAPVLSLAVGGGLEALAEPCSVNTLLDALEAWLQGGEEQQ